MNDIKPFNIENPENAKVADQFKNDKYGDLLKDDANRHAGVSYKSLYVRLKEITPDPRKYEKGPMKHYPGPHETAGIELAYYQDL